MTSSTPEFKERDFSFLRAKTVSVKRHDVEVPPHEVHMNCNQITLRKSGFIVHFSSSTELVMPLKISGKTLHCYPYKKGAIIEISIVPYTELMPYDVMFMANSAKSFGVTPSGITKLLREAGCPEGSFAIASLTLDNTTEHMLLLRGPDGTITRA